MARVVLDMNDRRPVWAIPDETVEEIRRAVEGAGDGLRLVRVRSAADGSGDGVGGPSPEVLEAVEGARVYLGLGVHPGVLEAGAPTLQWVHTGTAGVSGSLTPQLRDSGVVFTNSAGIHGPPMAETVTGMLLHFFRGLDFALETAPRWAPDDFYRADTPVGELGMATVGIVGYGGIGRHVARCLRGFGTRVLGLRRRPVEPGPGGGAPTDELGTELLSGPWGLDRLLAESDAVVLSVPDTPATRGLMDARRLAQMRPGAVLVNVARGSVVEEEALVEALESGRLRGAALDVFNEEPLPEDHPFRMAPRTLITPHVSGVSRGFWRRQTDLVLENLARFRDGRPLRNQVDPGAGY
ncbi:MAG: D-2-hydroxyacid dehydrogenase [Gemmatimonadales bacterium]|nr:MAG: D-2-hydroxyacid dehydrogenase [Gemmatimonadales bacterium]